MTCRDSNDLFEKGRDILLESDSRAARLTDTIYYAAPWALDALKAAEIPYEIVRGDILTDAWRSWWYPHPIVYFAAAIRGVIARPDVVKALIAYIQSFGITVLSEHVGADDPNAFRAQKAGMKKDDITDDYIERQDMDWLDSATHVIADVSGVSTGVGIEIGEARVKGQLGKVPAAILCIWDDSMGASQSGMIQGMSPYRYPNVTVRSYQDLDHAKALVYAFLEIS